MGTSSLRGQLSHKSNLCPKTLDILTKAHEVKKIQLFINLGSSYMAHAVDGEKLIKA